jgi:DNA processing protein
MRVGMRLTKEQVRILALRKVKGVSWHLIAREAQRPDGVDQLWSGIPVESSPDVTTAAGLLAEHRSGDQQAQLRAAAQEEIDKIQHADVRLITVIDDGYPPTLRLIYNLPPFLFIRGAITDADLRSVAVVGTRTARADGISRAGQMARLLVGEDVTVVSGLARGIDTAAHMAALEAGGRTIAVIGTGINR